MSRRTKIIILIVVIGILLFAVGAGWYFRGGDSSQPINFFNLGFNDPEPIDIEVETEPVAPAEVSEAPQFEAFVVARLFTERFGTFSNADNFAGVELVRPYITSGFSSWFDSNYKQQLAEKYGEVAYAGETVKVLGVEMESEDDTTAVANVRTQRTIRTDSGDQVSYQTLRLEMVKPVNVWLIDGAYWQNQ